MEPHYHVSRAGAHEPGPAFTRREDAERLADTFRRRLGRQAALITVEPCDQDDAPHVYGPKPPGT